MEVKTNSNSVCKSMGFCGNMVESTTPFLMDTLFMEKHLPPHHIQDTLI